VHEFLLREFLGIVQDLHLGKIDEKKEEKKLKKRKITQEKEKK